uniref:Uncharacterized protein n=1 Tax=Photobacterium damselae subsp. damselae TaxID=85581 RepID=E4WLL4_PHODD|nr:hypothetical protein [Photobacterium damselae subsp. damselae]
MYSVWWPHVFCEDGMGLKGHELVALRKATTREKRRLRYSH